MEIKNKKTIQNENTGKGPIVIIRIHGEVKVKEPINEALNRLRLLRKYTATIVQPAKENNGMIEKVKHYIAYGEIDKETLVKLLEARGVRKDKKDFDAEKTADEIIKGKSLKETELKPFFRLHPPRGGIKSKLIYPKGVLGNNKENINKLILRML
ncbi:MAG: uL30 family ribosomal protein [Candidatus Nanoarchaeia archaeon]